eukprot:1188065-Prorocentrum_minimum.AAC.3
MNAVRERIHKAVLQDGIQLLLHHLTRPPNIGLSRSTTHIRDVTSSSSDDHKTGGSRPSTRSSPLRSYYCVLPVRLWDCETVGLWDCGTVRLWDCGTVGPCLVLGMSIQQRRCL